MALVPTVQAVASPVKGLFWSRPLSAQRIHARLVDRQCLCSVVPPAWTPADKTPAPVRMGQLPPRAPGPGRSALVSQGHKVKPAETTPAGGSWSPVPGQHKVKGIQPLRAGVEKVPTFSLMEEVLFAESH